MTFIAQCKICGSTDRLQPDLFDFGWLCRPCVMKKLRTQFPEHVKDLQ